MKRVICSMAFTGLLAIGCVETDARGRSPERWVGVQAAVRPVVADGGEADSLAKVTYDFIFEYANGGVWDGDRIESHLLVTADTAKVVVDSVFEGDSLVEADTVGIVCAAPWMAEDCRDEFEGLGSHMADDYERESILIRLSDDIPGYSSCRFSGDVVSDTASSRIWEASLRCDSAERRVLLAQVDFFPDSLDGRLPEEASDSLEGSGDWSGDFKLDPAGNYTCRGSVVNNDGDVFDVDFHDGRRNHGWFFGFPDDADYQESVEVRNYPEFSEVKVGTGTLHVDATGDWSVWCEKDS